MQVRFAITPQLLFRAQRAIARHVRWMHWSGYFVVLVFPLFMIGITLAYGGTVTGAIRGNAYLIIGLPVFWLVGIPLLQRWGAGRMQRNTPTLQGEHVYTFTADGADLHTGSSKAHLDWSAFVRATETREFVLLFQNKMVANFVPKSAFASDADLARFKVLVSASLGPRAEWVAAPERVVAAI